MSKDKDVTRREIIKELMLNRTRINLKMSMLAGDLMIRARRHDNSYTSEDEMNLLLMMKDTNDEFKKERYWELVEEFHAKANDYLPAFHEFDISKMNILQLTEYIIHMVCTYDKKVVESNADKSIEAYTEFVISGLGCSMLSDDIKGIIRETVEYIVDRNASIIKNLPKGDDPIDVKRAEE